MSMSTMTCDRPRRSRGDDAGESQADGELLVRYAQDGDRRAFDELVRRYEREIFNYLRKYLGDRHLAEDAFQATFLQLHRKCRQFEPGRELRPWLYRIAANQANDLLRRNRRHKAISLDGSMRVDDRCDGQAALQDCLAGHDQAPDARLETAEDCRQVASAVDQLPDWLKQPVVLVILQGFKYREAASQMGIPLGTLKSRLYEAVKRIGGRVNATIGCQSPAAT
jgi:RNA polymerase sigma-70 factor (ECF subfamily)